MCSGVLLKLAESDRASAGVGRGAQWLAGPARACSGSSCLLEKFLIFDAILTRLSWWRFWHHLEDHISRSWTVAYARAASWMRCSRRRWLSFNEFRLKDSCQAHLGAPFFHPSSSCHFSAISRIRSKRENRKAKPAYLAKNSFSWKPKSKSEEESHQEHERGCSWLSGDGRHRWCPCVAEVQGSSWKISSFVFSWFSKSAAVVFKICSFNFSGSMSWLKIRWTLHHASQQRLSHWLGAQPVRSAASTSTRLQRDLTFLIWHFSFRLCRDAALSVSDSCLGGLDLASILVTIHAARLRHSGPTSASSRPLRSRSSTQVLCCSEFLHFCLIFHLSNRPLILNQNISAHKTELKNRPPLVDAAHSGLSNALPGHLCSPATAILSWRYFCMSSSTLSTCILKFDCISI